MKTAHEVLEVNREELQAVLEQARKEPLDEAGYEKLQALLRAFSYVADLIGEKDTTISQLRALLMKPSTEKTNKVLEQAGLKPGSKSHLPDSGGKAKPGHGRNGAEAYRGAERIHIPHASLKPGDCCPGCLKGKVYAKKLPALRIRVVGQAPLRATVYELESLRCNLCGEVFEAEAPEGVGEKKYDESAGAMIALLKYGSGVPFYRLAGLEKNLGIPLPASTQWEIVEERRRTGGRDSVRFRRTDPPGGTRGSLSQGRHQDDDPIAGPGECSRSGNSRGELPFERAHGAVHFRHCVHETGAADRAVFHRAAARGRELRPSVGAPCRGAASADSNGRWPVVELCQAAEDAAGHHRKL